MTGNICTIHALSKDHVINLSQDPVRSAIIDSCIRVTDNGRESIQRKVWHWTVVFIYPLHPIIKFVWLNGTFFFHVAICRSFSFSLFITLLITMINWRCGSFLFWTCYFFFELNIIRNFCTIVGSKQSWRSCKMDSVLPGIGFKGWNCPFCIAR